MTEFRVAAATGHRPQHLPRDVHDWVRQELRRVAIKLRDEHGTRVAVSGFAIGADLWWADAAVQAGLDLHAHIPFEAQPERWRAADRREWQRLRSLAADVTVYGPDPVEFVLLHDDIADVYAAAVKLLFDRNRGMMTAAQEAGGAVVAVWSPSKPTGGTAGALRDAVKRGLAVVHVNPDSRTVHAPGCSCLNALNTTRRT